MVEFKINVSARNNVYILILVILTVAIAGCINQYENTGSEKNVTSPATGEAVITSQPVNNSTAIEPEIRPNATTNITVNESCLPFRKNCRELNGHLCSGEGQCALPWLNSSDSYCCSIECGKCLLEMNCEDGNKCTEDVCSNETNFQCRNYVIEPCINN